MPPTPRKKAAPTAGTSTSDGTRADHVAGYLLAHIRRHRLQSGERLPSEIRLTQDLQVSRGVIREAHRTLAASGVIDIANGRSPRVARLNGRAVSQLLQHGLSTDQISQEEVFDARRTIEVRAAALAATNRSDEDVTMLARAVADMRAAGHARAPFIDADMRFHNIVGRATGNLLFHLLSAAIRESLDETIQAGLHTDRSSIELDSIVDVHAAIADAIALGRSARARHFMKLHFADTWRYAFASAARSSRGLRPRRRAAAQSPD